MALKIVHYALIALVIAICIGYLYWRWRKVNNQNKALEAELRLVQPYNNIPDRVVPEIVQMRPPPPPLQFQTVDLAAAKANLSVAEKPQEVPVSNSPPVLTPTVATIEEESDDDDEEHIGSPPMVTVPVPNSDLMADPMVADTNFTADIVPGIVEIPDNTTADESVIDSVILEDSLPAKTTTRRRRK